MRPVSLASSTVPSGPARPASRAADAAGAQAPADRAEAESLPLLETPKKAIETLASGYGYAEFPQASPDGKKVLFNVVGDYYTSQMILMDADGGNPQALLTGERVTPRSVLRFLQRKHGKIDEQGTFTSDGKAVYYRTNVKGPFAIARFDLEAEESKVVVADPKRNLKHPVETVDGYILGYGGPPDPKIKTSEQYSDLFLADPRDGSYRLLTHSDGSVAYKHPAEMDGMILAHAEPRGGGAADLVAVDPRTGAERNLTESPESDERHPFYNEEVGLVAFHSDDTGDKNLWIATRDMSRRVQLTFYGKAAQSPSWSPDGRTIYFVKKQEKQAEGEPFFARQADIRSLDVRKALKDLKKQAAARLEDLEAAGASEALRAAARTDLENYRYFLGLYD